MHGGTALLLSLTTWGLAASPPEHVECKELYEIAAATALPILPEPLHAFFESRLDALREAAAPGASLASGSKRTNPEPQWHYVTLDIAVGAADRSEPSAEGGEGSGPSLEERRAAARRFPRERDKALALYESCGVRDGGLLPWIVQDRYEAAVQAFRGGDPERIIVESGALLHFCVDAAMPCNTTTDRPRRLRDQTELFNKLKIRLGYEVRVAPHRLLPVNSALDATFDVLLDAHLAAVMFAEQEANEEKRAERMAQTLETQIESGALLGANMIAAAWTEADKPELRATAVLTPQRLQTVPHAIAGLYVGSRHSTVYHRLDCSHALQIKMENRVTFNTQEQAHTASRTPCKTCKPDAWEKPPPR